MAKRKAKKKSSGTKVGLALAGAAVAATAGAYYLYGPSGKKHRRQVKGWMLKAKGEVLEQAEKLKEIDGKAYHALVDDVSKKYKKLKHVNSKDVAQLSQELKAHWVNIEKDLGKRARSGKKVVKKIVRKVAKGTQAKKRVTPKRKASGRKKAVGSGRSKARSSSKRKRTVKRK